MVSFWRIAFARSGVTAFDAIARSKNPELPGGAPPGRCELIIFQFAIYCASGASSYAAFNTASVWDGALSTVSPLNPLIVTAFAVESIFLM